MFPRSKRRQPQAVDFAALDAPALSFFEGTLPLSPRDRLYFAEKYETMAKSIRAKRGHCREAGRKASLKYKTLNTNPTPIMILSAHFAASLVKAWFHKEDQIPPKMTSEKTVGGRHRITRRR